MAETALTSSAVASSDDIVAAHPNTIRADLINHTHGGTVTPIIAADTIKTLTGARTLTLPTGQDDTVVTLGAAQTLAGPKTLTSPVINTPTSGTGIWGINETANTGMTTGLTINQGAADDEILALKSSDVTHGITDLAETDTYALLKKNAAATGGVLLEGFADTGVSNGAAKVVGILVDAADTTKSTAGLGVIQLGTGIKSALTGGAVGADGNLVSIDNWGTTRFIFDAEGTLHSIGATTTERFGNGESLLVGATLTGIIGTMTLNDPGVSHAMTSEAPANTYAFAKVFGSNGGLYLAGLCETGVAYGGMKLLGATTDAADTTKSSAGRGLVELHGAVNVTGSFGGPGANANIVAIRCPDELGAATQFLFDIEGSAHADVEWIAFAEHDDLALISDIERELLSRESPAGTASRQALEGVGIIGKDSWHMKNGRPRAMVNMTKLAMLHHGALIQMGQRFQALEAQMLQLKGA